MECWRTQLHDLCDRRHSRGRLQFPPASPISASVTPPSTAAAATPTSIRQRDTNSRRSRDLPTTSRIRTRNYRSGVDFHVDWGASQVSVEAGVCRACRIRISADHGRASAPIRSWAASVRVFSESDRRSVFLFPVGDMQGCMNLKGYGEFEAANRPSGWNTWLTFSISPMAPAGAVTPSCRPPPSFGQGSRHGDLALADALWDGGDLCVIDAAGNVVEDDIDRQRRP